MKVRPLHDKVLVERLDTEETTKGGIIIPDTAKEKPQEGKVVAVGTGRILEDGTKKPLEIKKGDKVLFNKYGAIDISIDGEDYLILREEDILAIVD
ncbi:MAG: co-chaperone GroES [Candidatus Dadabacteria bacterium]|jgi:chaperonin GroES|nr:MAG: co-chaperone GroES [Candidatus Dadabacteria bacterium]